MAIRVTHQPVGIGGLAAYASGRGRQKERDRKYATDLLLSQQGRRDKYNMQATQQAFLLERDQQQAERDVAGDVRRNNFRIGEVKLADELATERGEARDKVYADRDKLGFDRDLFLSDRDAARKALAALPATPEGLDPDTLGRINDARSAISAFASRDFDTTEPETGAGLYDSLNDFYSTYNAIEKPSVEEQATKNIVNLDGTQYQYVNGKLDLLPQDPAIAAQQKALEAEQKAQQKAIEDEQKAVSSRAAELSKDVDPKTLVPKYKTPAEQFAAAQKEYDEFNNAKQAHFGGAEDQSSQPGYGTGGGFSRSDSGQVSPQSSDPVMDKLNPPDDTQIATPASKAEFDALPKGTVFIAPDGSTRRK